MASIGRALFSWRHLPEAGALPLARALRGGVKAFFVYVMALVILAILYFILMWQSDSFVIGFGMLRWRLADYGLSVLHQFAIGLGLLAIGIGIQWFFLFWLCWVYSKWRRGDELVLTHLFPFGVTLILSGFTELLWVGFPAEEARLNLNLLAAIPLLFGVFFLITARRAQVQIRRGYQPAAVAPVE